MGVPAYSKRDESAVLTFDEALAVATLAHPGWPQWQREELARCLRTMDEVGTQMHNQRQQRKADQWLAYLISN